MTQPIDWKTRTRRAERLLHEAERLAPTWEGRARRAEDYLREVMRSMPLEEHGHMRFCTWCHRWSNAEAGEAPHVECCFASEVAEYLREVES